MTWRELQDAFLQVRNRFAASESRAQWRIWVEAISGQPASRIALESTSEVPPALVAQFEAIRSELDSTKPIQQIIGFEVFDGLRFTINDKVLIPRPETEELVVDAAQIAPCGARIADLGTGSGCIAVALAARRPDLAVTGLDCSPEALSVASANGAALGVSVNWILGDLNLMPPMGLEADMILSNPPYVRHDEWVAPEVADHEPHLALFAPAQDPLHFYRRIAVWADALRATQIGLECHRDHAYDVAQLLGLLTWECEVREDQFGQPRWVWARRPPGSALPLKA